MRNIRKTVRLTEAEYNKIKEKINNDISFSYYVRNLLLSKKCNFNNKKDNQKILHELNRWGNNLNQIAKWCNTQKNVDTEILDEVKKIRQELQKLLKEI